MVNSGYWDLADLNVVVYMGNISHLKNNFDIDIQYAYIKSWNFTKLYYKFTDGR